MCALNHRYMLGKRLQDKWPPEELLVALQVGQTVSERIAEDILVAYRIWICAIDPRVILFECRGQLLALLGIELIAVKKTLQRREPSGSNVAAPFCHPLVAL